MNEFMAGLTSNKSKLSSSGIETNFETSGLGADCKSSSEVADVSEVLG